MVTIQPDSEAARLLAGALASGQKVSIEERANGIAIKTGEHMWSPTLRVSAP